MTTADPPVRRFPLFTASAVVLATGASFLAVSWFATAGLGRPEQLRYAFGAVLLCTGFGLIGLLPVALLERRMVGGAAYGFLVAMTLRLVGIAAIVLIAQGQGAPRAFGYWVAGCYVVLLAAETAVVAWYVKRHSVRSAGPERPEPSPRDDGE